MLASKQIQITFVWMEIMPKTFFPIFAKEASVKSSKSLRSRRKKRGVYFDGGKHPMYTRNAAKKGAVLKKSVKATLIITGT